jgi:hypothetical protein
MRQTPRALRQAKDSGLKSQDSDLKKETQEDEAIRVADQRGCEIVKYLRITIYELRLTRKQENQKS